MYAEGASCFQLLSGSFMAFFLNSKVLLYRCYGRGRYSSKAVFACFSQRTFWLRFLFIPFVSFTPFCQIFSICTFFLSLRTSATQVEEQKSGKKRNVFETMNKNLYTKSESLFVFMYMVNKGREGSTVSNQIWSADLIGVDGGCRLSFSEIYRSYWSFETCTAVGENVSTGVLQHAEHEWRNFCTNHRFIDLSIASHSANWRVVTCLTGFFL